MVDLKEAVKLKLATVGILDSVKAEL